MTTTTCTRDHSICTTRYCSQCGKKLSQPILDLRAHCASQEAKAHAKQQKAAADKWLTWLSALDALIAAQEKPAPPAKGDT